MKKRETKINHAIPVVIPFSVAHDSTVSPSARILYGDLCIYADNDNICRESNTFFADIYGVAMFTVSKWVKELEKHNLIECRYINNDRFLREIILKK